MPAVAPAVKSIAGPVHDWSARAARDSMAVTTMAAVNFLRVGSASAAAPASIAAPASPAVAQVLPPGPPLNVGQVAVPLCPWQGMTAAQYAQIPRLNDLVGNPKITGQAGGPGWVPAPHYNCHDLSRYELAYRAFAPYVTPPYPSWNDGPIPVPFPPPVFQAPRTTSLTDTEKTAKSIPPPPPPPPDAGVAGLGMWFRTDSPGCMGGISPRCKVWGVNWTSCVAARVAQTEALTQTVAQAIPLAQTQPQTQALPQTDTVAGNKGVVPATAQAGIGQVALTCPPGLRMTMAGCLPPGVYPGGVVVY